MKAKMMGVALLLCFAGAAVCLAENPNMGTWQLNEAKSTFSAGAQKNKTVVYEAAGDSVKVTIDGASGDGQPTHSEWTGKFDGHDYPVTGDSNSDARTYKKVSAHTMTFVSKKGDKVTQTGRIVVSADGKTRTVVTSGTDSNGKKFSVKATYDKQ